MTKQIELSKIDRGTNIREEKDDEILELTQSIRQNGLLNPLTVVKKGARYEVVAGHRRFKALQILREPYVECNVLEYYPTEKEILCIQLQENCCRRNMSAWEYADLFRKLQSQGMTGIQISALCGKSQAWVSSQLMAAKCLEIHGDLNAMTKKMTLHDVRKKYGNISDRTRKHKAGNALTVDRTGNLFMVRVNDKKAEKELISFLEKLKEKYQKEVSKWQN